MSIVYPWNFASAQICRIMDHLDFRVLDERPSTCVDYFICVSTSSTVKMKIKTNRFQRGVLRL